ALFASRFRECAARALLLPRRDPGRRAPLWQQRHRSAQLLDVVGRHPDFPILHETVRECLHDVYDLPALRSLLTRLGNGDARFHEAETQSPSPFATSLLFDYIGTFIYDGDVPLAERRAAALTLDPALLTQLLGEVELSELLDPEVLDEAEDRLQWLADDRRARDSEAVADLLRVVGPLSSDAVERRTAGDPGPWLERLADARRIFSFGRGGLHWAVVEDAARLRDGLGVMPPEWLPAALAEPVADPLGDIVGRYARTHGPFTARAAAGMLGLGIAVVDDVLGRLARDRRVVRGSFRPRDDDDETGWCDAEVLRTVRRRSLDRARRDLEPVPRSTLGRFLPAWQHVARPQPHPPSTQPSQPSPASTVGGLRGIDGLFTAIDQLAGAEVPASALEPLVLAGRVVDYRPAMLDELTASGEVLWSGHGRSGARDGWVRLHTAESAPETLRPPTDVEDDPLHHALIEALSSGGGYFFRQLVDAAADAAAVPGDAPVADDAAAAAPAVETISMGPSSFWWISWVALPIRNRPPPIRIRSRHENACPNSENSGAVRPTIQAIASSRPNRVIAASMMPRRRALSRRSGGNLPARIEMKMMLSMPSTSSSAVSVARAIQISGLARCSMGGLLEERETESRHTRGGATAGVA
ncbi:MAG: hypothetical protein L0H59_17190, partial [Tomitella sp.]|nr:hypothetical protein [Tomitella sp.]